MIYIIILLLTIILSIPIKILGKKHILSYIFLGLIIFMLCFFSGIRYGVGTDFWTYKGIFEGILNSTPEDIEPLFYLSTAVIRNITSNAQVFFIITSIIINMLIILIIFKKSSDFTLSLFLYVSMGFYLTSFNILRQFMAMAIMFYIINYRENLRKLNIIIAVIIATGFHNTSIVMAIVLIFKKDIQIKKIIIIMTIISIVTYIFEPTLTNLFLIGKYDNYRETLFFSYGTSILYIVEYIVLIIFYYIYNKKIEDNNKFYLLAICVGLIFNILGIKGVLYNRISLIFSLYNVLLLPNILNAIDNEKERRFLKYLFYVLYTMKFILSLRNAPSYTTNFNMFY